MKRTLIALAAIALTPSVALAGDYKSQGGKAGTGATHSFSKYDKDGDGVLSSQEAAAARLNISKVDRDGDGKVSQSEWDQSMGAAGRTGPSGAREAVPGGSATSTGK